MGIPSEVLGPPTGSASELHRRARFVVAARMLSLGTAAIGVLGTYGWLADFPLLRQIAPSVPAINPLSALALIALAVAVHPDRRIPRWLRIGIALAAFAVGVLRALDFLGIRTELDIAIARWFVRPGVTVNRMALGTGNGLGLLGIAIVLRECRSRVRRAGGWFAIAAIAVGLAAALGHLYQAIYLSTIPIFTALAPQTALAIAALGFAFLFARPYEEPIALLTRESEGGLNARQIPPLVLVIPVVLAWIGLLGVRFSWYDFGTGVTIIVSLNVVLFEFLQWRVGARLDALDRQRAEAEAVVVRSRDQALEERAKDAAVLSSIGDGMYVLDTRGRIILLNELGARMLGVEGKRLLGRSITSIPLENEAGDTVPPSDRPARIALTEGRPEHRGLEQRFWYRRADGSRFPIEITVTPILRSGRVEGAVALFRDITHEFEMDRAKSEFVSLASHQLQAPLTAVSWSLELLRGKGSHTTEQLHLIRRAVEGNQRMTELVNTLLNVSRIDLGTFAIVPRPTPVGPVLTSVLEELQPKALPKRITIVRRRTGPGTLSADPVLLRIVFQNLIGNAVKYTPEGGRVEVSLRSGPRGFELRVSDTGYGIPLKEHARVFAKLYRGENVRTLVPEGDGLGLYITKSIVERSGGTIAFTSAEGRGTTFTVRWPRNGMREKSGNRQLS